MDIIRRVHGKQHIITPKKTAQRNGKIIFDQIWPQVSQDLCTKRVCEGGNEEGKDEKHWQPTQMGFSRNNK